MLGWFDANLVSILNGFAIGALLFILAVGLSIVFGMMDVLNLAHGGLYLVGSYLAFSFGDGTSSWGGFGICDVIRCRSSRTRRSTPCARRPWIWVSSQRPVPSRCGRKLSARRSRWRPSNRCSTACGND